MEIRASYVLVGAVVLGLLAGLAAFTVWMFKADVDRTMARYQIAFEGSITGLQDGSQVRYRGVPVGRVERIRIDPDNVEQILVDVTIEPETPVKEDTFAVLEMQGVTGLAFVQLRGGSQDSPRLGPGGADGPPRIASRPSALQRVFQSTPELLAQGVVAIERITALLEDENVAAMGATLNNLESFTGALAEQSEDVETLIGSASAAAQQVDTTSGEVSQLVGDVRRLTTELESSVDGLGDDTVATLAELRTAASALGGAAQELEGALGDVREPLDDFAGAGLYEFAQLIGETRRLVSALTRITTEFERDPTGFLLGDSQGFETE